MLLMIVPTLREVNVVPAETHHLQIMHSPFPTSAIVATQIIEFALVKATLNFLPRRPMTSILSISLIIIQH